MLFKLTSLMVCMIKELKKKNEENSFIWYVLLIASLISIMTGVYRDGFAALFPFLQKDFGLTRAQVGLLSTLFFFTSAFLAIYTGHLVDSKGSKWGLVFSSSIIGLFYILHSIAPNFYSVLFIAALTGIAASFNVPTVNKCIVEWFPKEQRGTALSLQSMALPVGGLLGAIALPFLGSLLGWRKTMIFPGVISFLFAGIGWLFYREKNREVHSVSKDSKAAISFWKNVYKLTKNKDLMKISIFGFFLGMMANSISAHFALFLFLDHNLSEVTAGTGFAVVQLGSILGRGAWGIFSDKFLESDKRKTFLYMGLLFWITTMFLNLWLKNMDSSLITLLFILAFLLGCFGNGWPGILNASIVETVEEEHAGMAVGFAYLFVRSGMMISPPIFGYIADLRGSYDLSWFLLGAIMLITSFIQYVSFQNKKQVELDRSS